MEVGVYEAKTHLPKLLARVARGETITITRHGKPVAVLGPVGREDKGAREQAWQTLAANRERLRAKGVHVSREEILSWIAQGRRG